MKEQPSFKLIAISVVIAAFIGALFSLVTPKTYLSKSQVAIFRIKVEDPDIASEESRNRWVWIRDGLNIKSALVTDADLKTIAEKNSAAKELREQFKNDLAWMDHLRKMINIQFTGADEFNFIVEVKAQDPKLAFDLNAMVFNHLRYLAIEADQKNFNALINVLEKKKNEEPQNAAFYTDKIKKMTFTNLLEQKQKENSFQVISSPLLNESPIWPNTKLIIVAFAFMGLVFGLALDYILKTLKR